MVNQALLIELKDIIKEDYGVKLSMQAISEIGNSLVGFFELLAKIEFTRKGENYSG